MIRTCIVTARPIRGVVASAEANLDDDTGQAPVTHIVVGRPLFGKRFDVIVAIDLNVGTLTAAADQWWRQDLMTCLEHHGQVIHVRT